ncbi:MAG: type II CAAX prenyl endopeptidase Rce1 family protein [Candidatus Bathyarchaeia archaeon]
MGKRLQETGITPRAILTTTFLALNIMALVSYVASLPLGLYLFFTPDGSQLSQGSLHRLHLHLIFWLSVAIPGPLNIGGVYLSLLMVYGVCFVVAWLGPAERFVTSMKKAFNQPLRGLLSNFLAVMPIVSAISLLLTLSIIALQDWVGVETGEISFENPYVGLFSLAYAPISEEVGFRLVPLGLTVALSLWWRAWNRGASRRELLKAIPLSLLHPSEAKRRLGVEGLSKAEWAMLLTSSLAFGLSHIMDSIGWRVGKVTSSSMVGMVLGLSYLRYGIHAPILIHWFFNYYLYVGDGFFPVYGPMIWFLHLLLGLLAISLWSVEWVSRSSIGDYLKGLLKKGGMPREALS